MLYYSASTRGFYDTNAASYVLPSDAVAITAELRAALLTGESAGKRIVADAQGRPVLADPAAPSPEDVCFAIDRERDRRMHTRFPFNGVWYQCREQDVVNITGAGAAALASLVAGTPWPAGFVWIAEDNNRVPMTAAEVIGLGNTYTAFRSALIFRASDLKGRVRAGETVDFLSDEAWE